MIIRNMEQKDFDDVLGMMRVFYDSPAVIHTASDEVLKRDILACIGEQPLVEGFVFEEHDKLCGYAMTSFSYTTEYGGVCVWLEDLYVMPEYRGMGISSAFFRFMEEHYKEAVRFKLEVETENETAIAAYKRNGYNISPYFEMTKEKIVD